MSDISELLIRIEFYFKSQFQFNVINKKYGRLYIILICITILKKKKFLIRLCPVRKPILLRVNIGFIQLKGISEIQR
jgi:hypothetical protein